MTYLKIRRNQYGIWNHHVCPLNVTKINDRRRGGQWEYTLYHSTFQLPCHLQQKTARNYDEKCNFWKYKLTSLWASKKVPKYTCTHAHIYIPPATPGFWLRAPYESYFKWKWEFEIHSTTTIVITLSTFIAIGSCGLVYGSYNFSLPPIVGLDSF